MLDRLLSARRSPLVLLALAWLLRLVRRARATRPEPLPPPPLGATTVLADDGTPLHAQVAGPADADVTMVFVHGFLARTIEFDMQWQAFRDKARLVRYDHRNHGRSGRSMKPVTVELLANDLAGVLRELAPTGKVVLVGHSMGGMTVLALALQQPRLFRERVAGVCLLATGAGHYIDGHRIENAFRWISRRHLLAPPLLLLRLLAPLLEQLRPRRTNTMRRATRRVVFGTTDIDPASVSQVQTLLEEPALSTLAALHGSLLRNDVVGALDVLGGIPVSVVTGAEDKLTRPEHSRRMAADLGPDAELVEVAGAGHALNQTRPTEVNDAILRLLQRVRAQQADQPLPLAAVD
jgi:pimeloyl-ACP methyl ester carboxylesterase